MKGGKVEHRITKFVSEQKAFKCSNRTELAC
jgi:hypothetical protein